MLSPDCKRSARFAGRKEVVVFRKIKNMDPQDEISARLVTSIDVKATTNFPLLDSMNISSSWMSYSNDTDLLSLRILTNTSFSAARMLSMLL